MNIKCCFCGEEIPQNELIYRAVRGFERIREEGGANQIYLREPKRDEQGNEIFAHPHCIQERSRGLAGQLQIHVPDGGRFGAEDPQLIVT